MYKINFTPRPYQEEIAQTARDNNLLCVLPTGMGKTKIAILTAIKRLNEYPVSNILILTPTKPLSAQIQKEFKESTNIPEEQIMLLTGEIQPKKRQELWEQAIVTTATPQTILKDLENNRISLSPTSLLVVDESHRSRENFANTKVAQYYIKQSKFPRILALTASPGSTKERINEIKQNLYIKKVEIRTEEDIKEFIQKKEIIFLEVTLPFEIKQVNDLIKEAYRERLKELSKIGYLKPASIINKTDLIVLQQKLRKQLDKKNPIAYYGISLVASLIKIDYASELLETQGLVSLSNFFSKLKTEETKAAKAILNIPKINMAINLTNALIEKNIKHPKLYMLKGIIRRELENPESKIIIFANYRDTIDEILEFIKTEDKVKAAKLIGQRSGLSQKEQIETIKKFKEGIYNVLVGTSIMEEGIDIPGGAELAIFYDTISSEIRTIQRRGRVGRIKAGKIIFLVTNNTREQGYRWSAYRKEKKMETVLKNMQKEKQSNLDTNYEV